MLLALDTSTRTIGVALYDGTSVLSESVWSSSDHHTVELAPAIAVALKHAGASVNDLEALATATGPGSFTGLRIGLALLKGLALARRLPVIGIPTLDILAAAQPSPSITLAGPQSMAAVLQAGRGRLATGWYQNKAGAWDATGEVSVLTIESLARRIQHLTLVCGELTPDERRILARKRKNVQLVSPAQSLRRPSFLAEIAWQRWQAGQVDDVATLAPTYLHYQDPIPG
ncbi:MAG: tRNA (adenosine(37)-N6)-threonylcarbamoyltransferase complex dimerization subunit type 1 TsaB [Omnitrophica WOR_2 bacterium]